MTWGRARARAAGALRVALALLLLAALVWYSEPAEAWAVVGDARPAILLWIPLLGLARIWILAQRCHVLIRQIHTIGRWTLARQHLIGAYASNFLPTAIGGDVIRIAMLQREQVSGASAVWLVGIERFLGFAALVVISAAGAFVIEVPPLLRAIVVALGVAVAMACVALQHLMRARGQGRPLTAIPAPPELAPSSLVLGFAWSLVLQVCSIGLSASVGAALGAAVPLAAYLALVPLVWLVTMLPITLGGLGLREAAFVYLFGTVGVSPAVSLGISLGTYAGVLVGGLGGAAILARELIASRPSPHRDG